MSEQEFFITNFISSYAAAAANRREGTVTKKDMQAAYRLADEAWKVYNEVANDIRKAGREAFYGPLR